RLLGPAADGDVARDDGEGGDAAHRVANGGDGELRPHAGAALPHPPAFALARTLAGRRVEVAPGAPVGHVRLRVEDVEGLPHGLVAAPQAEALGALVPGGDAPVEVDEEQRMAPRRLD